MVWRALQVYLCIIWQWQTWSYRPNYSSMVADLQSVGLHGFRCYDNIARNAKRQRVIVLALLLVGLVANLQIGREECLRWSILCRKNLHSKSVVASSDCRCL